MDILDSLCEGRQLVKAVASDAKGTKRRDDAFSYRRAENGNLLRAFHVYDMPAVLGYMDPDFLEKDKGGKFNLFYRRGYPPELTKGFVLNQPRPAITFEAEIDLKTQLVIGFEVYHSAVELMSVANMRQVKDVLSQQNNAFKRTLSLDPSLKDIIDECSDEVGYFIINKIKEQSELHLKKWLKGKSEGASFAFLDKENGYFVRNKDFDDFNLPFSAPMRKIADLKNLASISALVKSEKPPFSREKMRRMAQANNLAFFEAKQTERELKAKYIEPEAEEIDSFLETVFVEKNYDKANQILADKPQIGFFALRKDTKLPPKKRLATWDSFTKRSALIDSSGRYYCQSIITCNGNVHRNKIRDVRAMSTIEVSVFTSVNFWRDFMKDPEFANGTWNGNQDLFDMKDEVRSEASR